MMRLMAVTIRPAEPRDAQVLGKLGAMLMQTHYAFDRKRFLAPGRDAESGYASFLGSQLQSTESCIFVADDGGGRITGYVYVTLEPLSWKELRGPAGFVHDIAVIEEARRSGVAAQLMDVGVNWLRERGAPRVILWTAAQNEAAQTLFHRIGFRDTMIEMTMELDSGVTAGAHSPAP